MYPELRDAFGSTGYAAALQHRLAYSMREGRAGVHDFVTFTIQEGRDGR
jgi:hypothetical protein